MFPVLFTIGNLSISSFGLLLGIGVFAATYFIWRLGNIYDLDSEKVIDLIILTFLGGFLGARIYTVLFNLDFFDNFWKMVLINRYPGLSFWGGLFGGWAVLYFLVKRFKLSLWEILDFAAVGFFIAASLASLGCFFGGCGAGLPSHSIFATKMAGLVANRFPIQIIESTLFFLFFIYLWKNALRFHFAGKIFSVGILFLGIIKFILEFFRENQKINEFISFGHIFSLFLIILGIRLYYLLGRRSYIEDLHKLIKIFLTAKYRRLILLKINQKWYNFRISWRINFYKASKSISRRLNIKSNPRF